MRGFVLAVFLVTVVGCARLDGLLQPKGSVNSPRVEKARNPLWVELSPATNQSLSSAQVRPTPVAVQTNMGYAAGLPVFRGTTNAVVGVTTSAPPPLAVSSNNVTVATNAVVVSKPSPLPGAVSAPVITPALSPVAVKASAPAVVAAVNPVVATNVPAKPVVEAALPPAPTASALTGETGTDTAIAARVPGYVRREHLSFRNEEAAQVFLRQMARKDAVAEEVRVLSNLLEEKNAGLVRFAQALKDQFSISPESNYTYDAQTLAIYVDAKAGERSPARAEAGKTADVVPRREHMKLKDKNSEQQFLQLLAARRLTADELKSLQYMVREKTMELDMRERELALNYSITKDRAYQFNQQKLAVYELVPAPKGQGVAEEARNK